MPNIDFNSSGVRAAIAFGFVFAILWYLNAWLNRRFGLDFYGEWVLIIIGAGAAANWIYQRSEHGR